MEWKFRWEIYSCSFGCLKLRGLLEKANHITIGWQEKPFTIGTGESHSRFTVIESNIVSSL